MSKIITKSTKQGLRVGMKEGRMSCLEAMSSAVIAKRFRTGYGHKGPKLSEILKNTKIPQIQGEYSDEFGACALGAIGIETNCIKDNKIDWEKVSDKLGFQLGELDKPVKCPECIHTNSVGAMIPHLNDIHSKSNYEIGTWLEKHDL